jgi:hypothetical protein
MDNLRLKDYRIIRYSYKLTNDELGILLWDNMDDQEKMWVIKLTIDSVNQSSGDNEYPAWDIFFLKPKLENRINKVLFKYSIEYVSEDLTKLLLMEPTPFDEEFINKLNRFLDKHLTIDDVLDNIIEVGMENISIFEKYYLKKHKNE